MEIGTIFSMDRKNQPKPIHHLPGEHCAAVEDMFLPRLWHHANCDGGTMTRPLLLSEILWKGELIGYEHTTD